MSQRLIMTPSLQQAIKLLQMSKLELVEEIQQELTENPVLEEAIEDGPVAERAESESAPAEAPGTPGELRSGGATGSLFETSTTSRRQDVGRLYARAPIETASAPSFETRSPEGTGRHI
jgi:RNA polymerase sigma-54 factor